MNDRFKFRGKRLDNNEWYYGSYLYLHNASKYDWNGTKHETKEDIHFIIDENDVNYAVNPETIGQSTGFKDKNGKLIYEGDIINDKSNHIRVVVWEQDCFKYPALKTSRYFHKPISNKLEERKVDLKGKLTFQDAIGKCDKKHFEVIGNIYENKELLESEE